ncbi:MAG: hypothetical protein LCH32_04775 [Bacteroidetes bacterium]|nr:hypothetical protein [Bacteroidota bacterium]
MKRIYFITIILVLSNICSFAQTNKVDSLLLFEKQLFFTRNTAQQDCILFYKYEYALKIKNYQNAYQSYLRLEKRNFRIKKEDYYWNNTLICLDNFNFTSATQNFNIYKLNFDSLSLNSNLLGYLTYVNYDSTQAKYYYQKLIKLDSNLACLNCFYKLINNKYKKGKGYMITSGIVPGSGLIAMGKPLKGLTSLALVGGSVFGIYSLIQNNLYLNALSWGLNFGLKFYVGQIKLTNKEYLKKQEKLNKKCKSNYNSVLKKYFFDYKVSSLP